MYYMVLERDKNQKPGEISFGLGFYSLLQHHGWLKPYSVPLFRSPMDENQAAHILGAMELRHEGMFPGGCS